MYKPNQPSPKPSLKKSRRELKAVVGQSFVRPLSLYIKSTKSSVPGTETSIPEAKQHRIK